MIIAKVQVSGNQCTPIQVGTITKGLVGAAVSIEYTDSAWDDLRKTVVFRSYTTKDVLDAGSEVTIPSIVVSRSGGRLYMGVYGVDTENNVVIPTVWTDLGLIQDAATPSGDSSTDPSLPVWARIQDAIGDMDELDTETKSNLVSAVNEVFGKCEELAAGGAVQPDWSQNDETAADYVKNRPGGYSKLEDGTPVTRTVTCTTAITGGFKSATTTDVRSKWGVTIDGAPLVRVTYDNEDYIIEREYTSDAIGDEALEKYPFALRVSKYLGGGTYGFCDYTKTSGDHEITVTPVEETVVPIPEKYMSSIAHEEFPDTKIDTVSGEYKLSSKTGGTVFDVYANASVPTLQVKGQQWAFSQMPLIICNNPTFETALTDKEIYTGIVIKKDSNNMYGLIIDTTVSGWGVHGKPISSLPGD